VSVRVGRLVDIEPGQTKLVEVNGFRLALARVGDTVYAVHDTCSHQGGPLSEGRLSGARLACPWHGWMYDVRSGECVMPARGGRVPSYSVRVVAGEIFVEIRVPGGGETDVLTGDTPPTC
jgi:nitrite reductase/ring-hydroxylating ferredoxin subunit